LTSLAKTILGPVGELVDPDGVGVVWVAAELGVLVGSLEPPDPPHADASRKRTPSTPVV